MASDPVPAAPDEAPVPAGSDDDSQREPWRVSDPDGPGAMLRWGGSGG